MHLGHHHIQTTLPEKETEKTANARESASCLQDVPAPFAHSLPSAVLINCLTAALFPKNRVVSKTLKICWGGGGGGNFYICHCVAESKENANILSTSTTVANTG